MLHVATGARVALPRAFSGMRWTPKSDKVIVREAGYALHSALGLKTWGDRGADDYGWSNQVARGNAGDADGFWRATPVSGAMSADGRLELQVKADEGFIFLQNIVLAKN